MKAQKDYISTAPKANVLRQRPTKNRPSTGSPAIYAGKTWSGSGRSSMERGAAIPSPDPSKMSRTRYNPCFGSSCSLMAHIKALDFCKGWMICANRLHTAG